MLFSHRSESSRPLCGSLRNYLRLRRNLGQYLISSNTAWIYSTLYSRDLLPIFQKRRIILRSSKQNVQAMRSPFSDLYIRTWFLLSKVINELLLVYVFLISFVRFRFLSVHLRRRYRGFLLACLDLSSVT